MTVIEMLLILTMCNQMIEEQGLLGFDDARTCSINYKNLKEEVAGGDYIKYRKWYDENAENLISDYLNSRSL